MGATRVLAMVPIVERPSRLACGNEGAFPHHNTFSPQIGALATGVWWLPLWGVVGHEPVLSTPFDASASHSSVQDSYCKNLRPHVPSYRHSGTKAGAR
jgi:hypothetical protein